MSEDVVTAPRHGLPAGPLNGVRVLEIGHYIAAPHCAMMLADQGADVVKVEPLEGEPGRRSPPFSKAGDSLAFACHNRGKRSVAIDLRKAENTEALDALLRWADIVVTNYAYGIPEKLGFDFERLSAINPRAVMVHVTGYGTAGSRRDHGAFDPSIQAMSGFSDLTGAADGPPQISQFFLADHAAATHAAFAAMCALWECRHTGKGRKVDISMLETMTSQLSYHIPNKGVLGLSPTRHMVPTSTGLPHTFQTKDSPVMVMLTTPPSWSRFCRLVGHPEWIEDEKKVPKLSDNPEHKVRIENAIMQWFAERTSADAYRTLQEAGIVAGAFRSVSQLYDEEVAAGSGVVGFVGLARGGPAAPVPGPAFRMSVANGAAPKVPGLGHDTYEVLLEAGLTQTALKRLAIDAEQAPSPPAAASAQPA